MCGKTRQKPMENEKWINDGEKTGDVDRRAPPEQGEATTSAEVVTIVPIRTSNSQRYMKYKWYRDK